MSGRMTADTETLRALVDFSEREIADCSGSFTIDIEIGPVQLMTMLLNRPFLSEVSFSRYRGRNDPVLSLFCPCSKSGHFGSKRRTGQAVWRANTRLTCRGTT